MCYLYHHPLVPIMFPRNPPSLATPLKSHFGKGEAELTNFDYSAYSGLEAWADGGFARDVASRRSTTSTTHKYCEVAFAWQCVKQPEPGSSTNDSKCAPCSRPQEKQSATETLFRVSTSLSNHRHLHLTTMQPQSNRFSTTVSPLGSNTSTSWSHGLTNNFAVKKLSLFHALQ